VSAYSTEIAVRWSDMDAFGHVNNARTVTLLEEARAELLFGAAARAGGAGGLESGLLVAWLSVRYERPLIYSGAAARITLWVATLRAASFDLDYEIADGRSGQQVATALTQLVPYDLQAGRPRRLTDAERGFLAAYRDAGSDNG
jgi:acyl-CoA thioester hydrolase